MDADTFTAISDVVRVSVPVRSRFPCQTHREMGMTSVLVFVDEPYEVVHPVLSMVEVPAVSVEKFPGQVSKCHPEMPECMRMVLFAE